jgi:hypothetical protein
MDADLQRRFACNRTAVSDDAHDKGHGRAERRILKVTSVAVRLAFPYTALALPTARRRRPLGGNTGKWPAETIYAVTSLTTTQASPAEFAAIARGHWFTGDRLHWVLDGGLRQGPLAGSYR